MFFVREGNAKLEIILMRLFRFEVRTKRFFLEGQIFLSTFELQPLQRPKPCLSHPRPTPGPLPATYVDISNFEIFDPRTEFFTTSRHHFSTNFNRHGTKTGPKCLHSAPNPPWSHPRPTPGPLPATYVDISNFEILTPGPNF